MTVTPLHRPPAAEPFEPLLYRVSDVMEILNLSRTVIFDQIRLGRLRAVKQGRIRRIPASAVRDYVSLLEQESRAA